MVKKVVKKNLEIKEAIKNKKLIIGTNSVMKSIKKDELKLIFYASNCPEETKKHLNYYSNLSNIKIKETEGNSKILGETCDKSFNILIVGIKK